METPGPRPRDPSAPDPDPAPDYDQESLLAARAWLARAADPAVLDRLASIHADVASEVARRGPACWASGRCCNFREHGHRLYVSGLEAAATLLALDPRRPLMASEVADAAARGSCPFQSANLCAVHDAKPAACRIYFCDRSAKSWQEDLAEQAHARVRALHDDLAIPYRYAEWAPLLGLLLAAAGRPIAGAADSGVGLARPLARDESCSTAKDHRSSPVGLTVRGNLGNG